MEVLSNINPFNPGTGKYPNEESLVIIGIFFFFGGGGGGVCKIVFYGDRCVLWVTDSHQYIYIYIYIYISQPSYFKPFHHFLWLLLCIKLLY